MACKRLVSTSSALSTRPRSCPPILQDPDLTAPQIQRHLPHEAVSPDGGVLAGGYGLEARGEGLPTLRAHAEPEVRPPILMAPSWTEVEHVETRPVMPMTGSHRRQRRRHARVLIGRQLQAAGEVVQDKKDLNSWPPRGWQCMRW